MAVEAVAVEAVAPADARGMPNPSLHPTCYGWLRQPPLASELERYTSQG